MYLLGYDIGSSSVKASLIDGETGQSKATAFYPKTEAEIISLKPGWAEQEPEQWWSCLRQATATVMAESHINPADIGAIGISYQMHGLVCVDKDGRALRPAIIWCDSRAVPYGDQALAALGGQQCLEHLLNAPGNFTASKLKWVKENEPDLYARIDRIMLPGDYIAMRLTGETCTTVSGLSEGMMWDFRENRIASFLLDYYGIDASLLPPIVPTFGQQGQLTASAAAQLGLKAGTPVTYRAGDQPNNALSLNILEPGQIASTAGTSGVVYGVSDQIRYDRQFRVNSFAHVNHTAALPRLGILLCINGTGILNSWVRHQILGDSLTYQQMNELAATAPAGSDGLTILPFGNGAERMLENRAPGSSIKHLDFNVHKRQHLVRAAQEGIAFSFHYGISIMKAMGMDVEVIHAGYANLFLSPLFRRTLATLTGATIEMYDTDGAAGAARGAGIGAGYYRDAREAFASLRRMETVEPNPAEQDAYREAYARWKQDLEETLQKQV